MGSKELHVEDGLEVVEPVPPLITIPRLFADTPLRFNMEVLSKLYKRTSADALS